MLPDVVKHHPGILLLSIHQTHSPSSFAPLLVWSCDPLVEKRHSGFWRMQPFWIGFFPSLWIYLLLVFKVGDFQIGSLSGCPACWWWCFFCFLVFLQWTPLPPQSCTFPGSAVLAVKLSVLIVFNCCFFVGVGPAEPDYLAPWLSLFCCCCC